MMKLCTISFLFMNSNYRFFTPSILELKKTNNLYMICLSNGDADGFGVVREKELDKSLEKLGFKEWEIVNDEEL